MVLSHFIEGSALLYKPITITTSFEYTFSFYSTIKSIYIHHSIHNSNHKEWRLNRQINIYVYYITDTHLKP